MLNFHAITKFEMLNFHAITKFKVGEEAGAGGMKFRQKKRFVLIRNLLTLPRFQTKT